MTDNYFEQEIAKRSDPALELIGEDGEVKQFTLWTCLVCGHIGCFNLRAKLEIGDQEKAIAEDKLLALHAEQNGHAYSHYKESMHVYAMEIASKKVWDFSKENYVNRLI